MAPAIPTPVQYGFRDDDDDSEDEGRRRRSLHHILHRQSSNRSLKKLGSLINDTKSLLAGARIARGGLYHLDDSEEDDDDSSYESATNNDSDDGSVCSKASVASKASKTLKKLGGKFRGSSCAKNKGKAGGRRRHGSNNPKANGNDEEEDEMDDCSVGSRTSQAVKRVTGKLTKALRVVGRRNVEDSESEEESLFEEETDISQSKPGRRKFPSLRRLSTPLSRSKSFGEDQQTGRKQHPLRRSSSTADGPGHGPRDVHPTQRKPRRHTSHTRGSRPQVKRRNSVTKCSLEEGDKEKDDDGNVSDLSDDDDDSDDERCHHRNTFNPQTQYSTKQVYSNNWAMNVTQDMWEKANTSSEVEVVEQDDDGGGCSSNKKTWNRNVPNNLLVVDKQKLHSEGISSVRAA